jgi:transcriptional repressor NrdR
VADAIVVELSNSMTREVAVDAIGSKVLERLRDLDPVAYVRFLSVYREFERAEEFLEALSGLVGEGRGARGASAS